MVEEIALRTTGQGLHEVTDAVQRVVTDAGCTDGLCTVLIRHTSASLTIQENADPSARHDLERWMERMVPEGQAWFTHTSEGPDDMPSHIRAALTSTTLSIPVLGGRFPPGDLAGDLRLGAPASRLGTADGRARGAVTGRGGGLGTRVAGAPPRSHPCRPSALRRMLGASAPSAPEAP